MRLAKAGGWWCQPAAWPGPSGSYDGNPGLFSSLVSTGVRGAPVACAIPHPAFGHLLPGEKGRRDAGRGAVPAPASGLRSTFSPGEKVEWARGPVPLHVPLIRPSTFSRGRRLNSASRAPNGRLLISAHGIVACGSFNGIGARA